MTPEQHVVDRLTGFYREMEQALPGAPPPWRPERTRTARGSSWRMQALAAAGLILVAVAVAVLLQHGRPHSIVQPATLTGAMTVAPISTASFLNAQDGAVVAERGLLVTHDGGQHWLLPLKLDWKSHHDVRFVDRDHIVVVSTSEKGDDRLLHSTADGGAHWRTNSMAPIGRFGSVFFLNAREGWRETDSGNPKAPGDVAVYHTTDAGAHWTELWRVGTTPSSSRVPALAVSPLGLLFTDSRRGFMGTYSYDGVGRLYVTRDSGRTWQIAVLPPPAGGWNSGCCGKVIISARPTLFGDQGFLVEGGSGTPTVWTTSDGGQTWKSPRSMPVAPIFVDPTHWWGESRAPIGATGNELYRTADAGASWQRVPLGAPPAGLKFARVATISAEVIWASASGDLARRG
jgi:photosystem II stability/assembly factor-like uncharacterized protein